jgi:hypothetical protein
MQSILILGLSAGCAAWAAAADAPPAQAFHVLPPAAGDAAVITTYLNYQTEMAGNSGALDLYISTGNHWLGTTGKIRAEGCSAS